MNGTSWTRTRRLASPMLGLALVGLVGCGGGEPADDAEMPEEAPAPEAAAPAGPEAPALDPTELQTNAAAHEGMTVRLPAMQVSSQLGAQAAWLELPNKNPFLLIADQAPAAGSMVDVVGTIQPVNEAVLTEWVSSGVLTEDQRLQAEFATHYIQAESVSPSSGAPAPAMQ